MFGRPSILKDGNGEELSFFTRRTVTPFDDIYGTQINSGEEPEEHVRISARTGNKFIEKLGNYFDNSQRPFPRNGATINQTVDNKVAYTAKETLTLGGDGNSFTVKNGAEVVLTAGNAIRMLPGTTIEAGATFKAQIEDVDYDFINASGRIQASLPVHYSKNSPFLGKKYDYSTSEAFPEFIGYDLYVYPNPTSDQVWFSTSSVEGPLAVELVDLKGQVLKRSLFQGDKNYVLDLYGLPAGIYVIRFKTGGKIIDTKKIIKR